MGTWGSGNFDDDTAADHLSTFAARLVAEVEAALAEGPGNIEPDEYWGVAVPCNLELLGLLAQQKWVGVTLPPAATIAAWKATYLAVWDATIDGLAPRPDFKAQRRAVLVATFDQLAALAQDDAPPPAPSATRPKHAPPTKPAPTKPAPTKPAPTKPAPRKSAPTKPVPTKPAPTKPVPTKPAPTKPAPTTRS